MSFWGSEADRFRAAAAPLKSPATWATARSVQTLCGSGKSGKRNGATGATTELQAPLWLAVDRWSADATGSSGKSGGKSRVLLADSTSVRSIDVGTGGSRGILDAMKPTPTATEPDRVLSVRMDPRDQSIVVSSERRVYRVTQATAAQPAAVIVLAGRAAETGYADGAANTAQFHSPRVIDISPDSNVLTLADTDNQRIRCVDLTSKTVSTYAGTKWCVNVDGPTTASIAMPLDAVRDPFHTGTGPADLLVAAGRIRRINRRTHQMSTIHLSLASGAEAPHANGLCVTPSGWILLSCAITHSVYAFDPRDGECELIAGAGQRSNSRYLFGDGAALSGAYFDHPSGMVLHPDIYIADCAGSFSFTIPRTPAPAWIKRTETTTETKAAAPDPDAFLDSSCEYCDAPPPPLVLRWRVGLSCALSWLHVRTGLIPELLLLVTAYCGLTAPQVLVADTKNARIRAVELPPALFEPPQPKPKPLKPTPTAPTPTPPVATAAVAVTTAATTIAAATAPTS